MYVVKTLVDDLVYRKGELVQKAVGFVLFEPYQIENRPENQSRNWWGAEK